MELSAIIGGTSAVVSIATVVANLYIARKSRDSSIQLEELKVALKRLESTSNSIKDLEIEGERLRIRCWELIGIANTFNDPSYQHSEHSSEKARFVAWQSFALQAEAFLDKWAPVKTDIPAGVVEVLRTVRHQCRREIGAISIAAEVVDRCDSWSADVAKQLSASLRDLLGGVDHFIDIVETVRKSMGSGVIQSRMG